MQSRSFIAVAGTVLLVTTLGAACSSDGGSAPSAEEKVCTDADNLKRAVSQLVDDLKAGNFGNASDQVSNVQSAFKALESSAKDLASDKKTSVQQDVSEFKATLGDLTSASSLADIQSTLDQAGSQLKKTANALTKTLSC